MEEKKVSPSEKFNKLVEIREFLTFCSEVNTTKPAGRNDTQHLAVVTKLAEQMKSKATSFLDTFPTDDDFEEISGTNPDLFDDSKKHEINQTSSDATVQKGRAGTGTRIAGRYFNAR